MPDESKLVALIEDQHHRLFELQATMTRGVATKEDLAKRIDRLRGEANSYLTKMVDSGNELQDAANRRRAAAILNYWNNELYGGQNTWHLEETAKADK